MTNKLSPRDKVLEERTENIKNFIRYLPNVYKYLSSSYWRYSSMKIQLIYTSNVGDLA